MLPVLVFAGLAIVFAWGLTRDPRIIPSVLIDKPVPEFSLPPVKGGRGNGFSSDDLKGDVTIVNVFASWCVPCRAEHPLITELARTKIARVYGLNYKDNPADAVRWLKALGDSFHATGADLDGRVGIDWGVYGVPETFIIDRHGKIRHKQIGPMTPDILRKQIVPIIMELRK
jgi:cytochrome c biogenesis protein CcmG/thiol:disulfide interchange protein DsbE